VTRANPASARSGGAGEAPRPPAVTVTNAGVKIRTSAILDDISFKFPSCGVTGLIGQNGSGKSTLLKVLARQQRLCSGRVELFGASLSALSDRDFARQVAYLPQHTPLAPGLTARELIALGRYPWHGAIGRFTAQDAAQVDVAIHAMNLSAFKDRFVDSLSGGERQRCWIAMLLAQNARLLLLDEPISALDIAHQIHVLSLIRQIAHNLDIAVVLVIHDLNLACRYCDTLIALKQGRVAAQGAPEDFMIPEVLSDIFDVPMRVVTKDGMRLAFVQTDPNRGDPA
jgi:ferric hydroxamate transport system ATP-binding protein